MALNGTLEDFPLSDIFQLIGQQQKSGSLIIQKDQETARILFDQGMVLLGMFQGKEDKLLLGNILVQSRIITEDTLKKALEDQKSQKRSLGDILISKKALLPAVFKDLVRFQLEEVLFIVFQWDSGLYEFVPGKARFNPNYLVPQRAEAILMESFRRKDEWPKIKKEVGEGDTVYRKLSFSENLIESLEKNERRVLSMIDDRTDFEELVYVSRLGTFETGYTIQQLIQKDFIEIDIKADANAIREKESVTVYPLTAALCFLAGVLISYTLLNPSSYYHIRVNQIKPSRQPTLSVQLKDFFQQNQAQMLHNQLRLYRLNIGSYPGSLTDLKLSTDWIDRWKYSKEPNGFSLERER